MIVNHYFVGGQGRFILLIAEAEIYDLGARPRCVP